MAGSTPPVVVLLPMDPSRRARVLNAQRRLAEAAAKRLAAQQGRGVFSALDMAREANARRIVDEWRSGGAR